MTRAILATLAGLWIALSVNGARAVERVYYFHNDHLGTPQAMSDAAVRKVWEAEYEPFGKATVNQDPDGDGQIVVNNLRFPGQYYDAETGLHYNYHRDYDPETGQFLQPDPIGIQKGKNHLYTYAADNPIRHADPTGLKVAMCWLGSHASVKIESSCDRRISGQWGFFPDGTLNGVISLLWWVPGLVAKESGGACTEVYGDDSHDSYVFNRIAQDILDPPCYSLPFFNCVNWAANRWSGVGDDMHDRALQVKRNGQCGRLSLP